MKLALANSEKGYGLFYKNSYDWNVGVREALIVTRKWMILFALCLWVKNEGMVKDMV